MVRQTRQRVHGGAAVLVGPYGCAVLNCVLLLHSISRPRTCSDYGFFSGRCTSRTQCGVDQVSRVCVSWLRQPHGKGCMPSGVAGG